MSLEWMYLQESTQSICTGDISNVLCCLCGTTEFRKLSLNCNFYETCGQEDVLPLHFPKPIYDPTERFPIGACLELFFMALFCQDKL